MAGDYNRWRSRRAAKDPGAAAALEAVVGPRVRSLSLARNGQEGLLAFARYDPDLVVADVVMATCDGLAMLAATPGRR